MENTWHMKYLFLPSILNPLILLPTTFLKQSFSKFFLFLILFSSCIEILDDIKFNFDGSGTFKYTVNLSSSQVKLNSILALDSLDGKKVPSLSEIQEKIESFGIKLSEEEGISNVQIDTNYTQFIFKIQCGSLSSFCYCLHLLKSLSPPLLPLPAAQEAI